MSPVVIVSRDEAGQARKIEWFEDEHRAYDHDPMVVQKFEPALNLWWTASRRPTPTTAAAIVDVVGRLAENPFADVSDIATHHWPEPGAPLEPVVPDLARSVGCDLTPECPAVQHVGSCLGLYRTVDEVAREVVPEVSVLAQRRADVRFHRAYLRAGGGAA